MIMLTYLTYLFQSSRDYWLCIGHISFLICSQGVGISGTRSLPEGGGGWVCPRGWVHQRVGMSRGWVCPNGCICLGLGRYVQGLGMSRGYPPPLDNGLQSASRRYAPYWNALWFTKRSTVLIPFIQ